MENQQQIAYIGRMALTALTLVKKFCGQERLPPAAIFHRSSESAPCCAICLDDICGGDSYRKLPECGHLYHSKCIDAWFESHSTCPLCRTQIPQIITLNENQFHWNTLLSNLWFLAQDFLQSLSNPDLNNELTSMLCGNIN